MKEVFTGLVVCGGKSTRMGMDKSMLNYHGLPQRYYLYHLLEAFCHEVYLSCNREQAATIPAEYKVIVDDETEGNFGPLTGILSAHKALPSAHLLITGCDYPLVGTYEFRTFTQTTGKRAAAFRNAAGSIEPMISLWPEQDLALLHEKHYYYNHSLRKFLEETGALILDHPHPHHLTSVDTESAFHQMRTQLQIRS